MTDEPRKGIEPDPRSMIYRHVKTGGLYVVLHWEARMEATLVRAVVYQSLKDGVVWVRPYEVFTDGRFKCVSKDELAAFSKPTAPRGWCPICGHSGEPHKTHGGDGPYDRCAQGHLYPSNAASTDNELSARRRSNYDR